MKKYKISEIKNLVTMGLAEDITNIKYKNIWYNFEKVGYSCGIYGINGGLLQDPKTGNLYAIISRNSNLFRLF